MKLDFPREAFVLKCVNNVLRLTGMKKTVHNPAKKSLHFFSIRSFMEGRCLM
jgi:hypothetical protein